ncbi:MAG: formate dehydrogenase subunit beta [Alsobacter sp.]
MPSYPSLAVIRRSASDHLEPEARAGQEPVLAKLIDISKCVGCKACQSACEEWNDLRGPIGVNTGTLQNPPDLGPETWTLITFDEYEDPATGDVEWLFRKDGCMHCADPGCLKACPAPGAIVQYANGIVDFDEANCIGCGYCIKGCPFNIPRYGKKDRKAYKCTLCSDRVSVGLEPACVKTCPTGAISFGAKPSMVAHAAERVEDLKWRGFQNAGLYDPPGVGGTHVMYVLPHADRPERYGGLPANPSISPFVAWWKGGAKIAGLAAMGAAVLASAFHYLMVGRDVVPPEAEREASALRSQADSDARRDSGA